MDSWGQLSALIELGRDIIGYRLDDGQMSLSYLRDATLPITQGTFPVGIYFHQAKILVKV